MSHDVKAFLIVTFMWSLPAILFPSWFIRGVMFLIWLFWFYSIFLA